MSNHDRGLLVLATLLLAVTPTTASAQSIRLHGGVNHSTILLEEEEPGVELGRRLGRHFGVGYAVPLTDLAGLRFEANYHEKGFAADFSLDGAAVGSEAEVTYVEFAPSLVLGGGIHPLSRRAMDRVQPPMHALGRGSRHDHLRRLRRGWRRGQRSRLGRGRGSPAIQVRSSRFRGTVQQGPVQWQEWQIVQSQFDLRDLLP